MRLLALTTALAAALAASPALAGPALTLNGVAIDGVTDQKFENATVLIDAAGNVHITARGYVVKGEPAPPPVTSAAARPAAAAPPPVAPPLPPTTAAATTVQVPTKLSRRYFLATEQSQPDGTQFDVQVFINAAWIRVLHSADVPGGEDITRYLRPGTNKVTLVATKNLAGADRRNYTKDVTFRVVVGAGNVGGNQIMIDETLAIMTLTAADVDNKTEEYTVEAR
jgi:hypothetical protein